MAGNCGIPGRVVDQSFPAIRTAISLSDPSPKHDDPEKLTGAVPLQDPGSCVAIAAAALSRGRKPGARLWEVISCKL